MDIKTLSKKMRLSITTVSRALGGYSDVSEKTRKRVIRFAKKYNYSPNPYAKGLASGKSNVVGVVIPVYGINHSSLNQSHFFQFISGMTKTMIKDNIQFTMLFANSRKEEMQAFSNKDFLADSTVSEFFIIFMTESIFSTETEIPNKI